MLSVPDDADIVINTNGNSLPFGVPHNTICAIYVHFPVTLLHKNQRYSHSGLWMSYCRPYLAIATVLFKKAITRSEIVLVNSLFTKLALTKSFPSVNANLLYPPVDLTRFSTSYRSKIREQKVLTISRFSSEKAIDKIIHLANAVGKNVEFVVIGSLAPSNKRYFNHILQKIKDKGLEDRVRLVSNATNDELIEAMCSCSIYFHTMDGEHFGVSIIEAMAGGLIPIVPSFGGCSEIVPGQFQYNTIEDAAERIALTISQNDPGKVEFFYTIAQQFSLERFTIKLEQFIQNAYEKQKYVSPTPTQILRTSMG